MKNDFCYVYCLADPRNKKPFYIGVSECPEKRLFQHIDTALVGKARSPYGEECWYKKCKLIRSIIKCGKLPIVKVLKKTTKELAGIEERKAFLRYKNKGHKLLQNKNRVGFYAVRKNKFQK